MIEVIKENAENFMELSYDERLAFVQNLTHQRSNEPVAVKKKKREKKVPFTGTALSRFNKLSPEMQRMLK